MYPGIMSLLNADLQNRKIRNIQWHVIVADALSTKQWRQSKIRRRRTKRRREEDKVKETLTQKYNLSIL